jgi:hypothetical protein
MKASIRTLYSRQVHPALFALACVLLIVVALAARLSADRISAEADQGLAILTSLPPVMQGCLFVDAY